VQHVEPAVALDGKVGHRFGRRRLGHVAGEHRRVAALLRDLLGQHLGAAGIPVDQHDFRPFACEHDRAGHAVADALAAWRGTRHHRDLALQPIWHPRSPSRRDYLASAPFGYNTLSVSGPSSAAPCLTTTNQEASSCRV
jgi:hypothetical protein